MRSMSLKSFALLVCAAAAGCGDGGGDPKKPSLVIAMSPMDAVIKAPFELLVHVMDVNGSLAAADSQTQVTVKIDGEPNALRGTLTRTAAAGVVRFDDLIYDKWQTIRLAVSASGANGAVAPMFLVRPVMTFKDQPSFRMRAGGAIGPVTVRLVDGEGALVTSKTDQKVTLTSMPGAATIDGGPERTFTNGEATYDRIAPASVGAGTLVWSSPTLADLAQGIVVFDMLATEMRWMSGGRVGVPYAGDVAPAGAAAATFQAIGGGLQRGLSLDQATGRIAGTPTESRHARVEILATAATGGALTLYLADLSIFPAVEQPPSSLDALNRDGPHAVASLDDTVNVMSRQKMANIRVFYPMSSAAPSPTAKFPLVVFHHGAANTDGATFSATIYDRYDPLLKRWASHGFVVVTIDGLDLIFQNRMVTSNTYSVLTGISENQRATITHMRAKNDDAASPLRGRIDVDRVILAGHSRGAGGSLLTARVNADVMGAILLKPIDPIMSAGGETMWRGNMPPKPFLINVASADNDVIYPVCDYLYERRASVTSLYTIMGSVHNYTKASHSAKGVAELCPPEPGSSPTITRAQDHAITNVYSVAFLRYLGYGELGYAALLFDRPGLTSSLSPLGVLNRGDRGAGALVVDDFQTGDGAMNRLGGANTATGAVAVNESSMAAAIAGLRNDQYGNYLRAIYGRAGHEKIAGGRKLTWSAAGGTYVAAFPAQDVSARGAFVFRARSDMGQLAGTSFSLRFTDADGGSAMLSGAEYVGANGLDRRFADVIVPVGEIKGAGANTARITSVGLILGSPAGALLIDDLRFE